MVGQVMVIYSCDWTKTGFSFILLTVNLFRHPTLIERETLEIISTAWIISQKQTKNIQITSLL